MHANMLTVAMLACSCFAGVMFNMFSILVSPASMLTFVTFATQVELRVMSLDLQLLKYWTRRYLDLVTALDKRAWDH